MVRKAKRIEDIDLGKIIRDRRKKLGLKVYELAKKAGVNPVYITQIEKNFKTPAPSVFLNILKGIESKPSDIKLLSQIYIKKKYPAIYEMAYYPQNDSSFSTARLFGEIIQWGDLTQFSEKELLSFEKHLKKRIRKTGK